MRKLLLTSSALVAAASISSYALADVSVTGAFEWRYTTQSSSQAAEDGTEFGTDNEVTIKFTNKTDTGLTVTGVYDFDADGAGDFSGGDESHLTIAGGFGTVSMGLNDAVNDSFGIGEHDLIDEDLSQTPTGSSIVTTAGESGNTDANKISYITPAMGGFQAGYSLMDSGTAVQSEDQTAMGVSYTMPLAGGSLMVRYNKQTTDGAAADETEAVNYGAKLTMGAASVIVAKGESTIGAGAAQTDDREANGISVRYDLGGGISIGASTVTAEDDKDKTAAGVAEKYTANIAEVTYTVAPGLAAAITYLDYDYTQGGETAAGNTDDSGSITQLTISASF
jgi:hypothetical protein